MAGIYELLFSQSFTSTDTVVVTHNLDREYVYIKLIVGSENRQDLLSRVNIDPSDPTNKLTVKLRSVQSGIIQLFGTDIISEGDHSASGKNIKVQKDTSDIATNVKTFNFEGSVTVVDAGNDTATITISGDPDQNLWETIAADTGSTSADTTTDTLTIAGGTNVTTSITGDTLTINASNGLTGLTLEQITGADSELSEPMIFIVDTTRSNKVLSSECTMLPWSEPAVSNNDWIQIGGATDTDVGYIMPYDGTIIRATLHTSYGPGASNTMNIELWINSSNNGAILSVTGTGQQQNENTNLNLDFSAGDKIRLKGDGDSIGDTIASVWVKWRTA